MPKNYYNIMVWAIMPPADSSLRQQMETHLVNDLVDKGYHAISALDVYSPRAYARLTADEVVKEFKKTGVDAVFTLVLLKKENEEMYYQPNVFLQPVEKNGNFSRYYSTMYEKVLEPGYYIKTTNYYWEGNFFEVNTDKLVYAAQTKTFDPVNTDELAHDNGLKFIGDLLRKKIIKNKNKPILQ